MGGSAQSQCYSWRSSGRDLSRIVASLLINQRLGKDFQWKLSLSWLLYPALCNIKGLQRFCFFPQIVYCSSQRSEYKTQYIIFQNVFVLLFAIELSAKRSSKLTDPNQGNTHELFRNSHAYILERSSNKPAF